MGFRVGILRSPWPRAIALGLVAIGASGCSGESRFGDPTARSQGEATGSIGQAAPVGQVESRPLPQTSQLPPPSTVVGGGGRGMASYAPPPAPYNPPPAPIAYNSSPAPVYTTAAYHPASEVTGSVVPPAPVGAPTPVAPPPSVVRKPASQGKWSWDGGTAVTVAPGETVDSIARRHGVPVAAVMEANNLSSPNAIQAGQRLVIPRYIPALAVPAAPSAAPVHAVAPAPVAPRPVPAPVPTIVASASPHPAAPAPANSEVHVVAAGDTLSKISRQYGKSVGDIAKANNISPSSKMSIGDRIIIPGGAHVSNAKPELKAEAEPTAAPAKPAPKVLASAAPAQSASLVTPASDTPTSDPAVAKPAADSTPGFRWPVRGRIIAGFGPKPNGQQNDGIDVAVPENTPVKAAEDGVVAYAGNELKGYGNLVLVRHPNGYVTAYAHAKELLVKRGDQIKRGEVIAKSGQSGNVEGPELHFEVRKGSTPVDPMQFLSGV